MAAKAVNLEDTEIIISGGRGLGDAKGFALLQELADLLGGAVGASHAAVDQGWIPQCHQVGQTGKTVRSRLYIACGISGAIQHMTGMQECDTIVAINNNPDAPIHQIADFSIVDDLYQVLPILIQTLKDNKAEITD